MSKCEACSWENERVSRLDRYAIAAMQGMLSSETAGAGVALPCEPRRDGEFEMLANRAVEQALRVMCRVEQAEASRQSGTSPGSAADDR